MPSTMNLRAEMQKPATAPMFGTDPALAARHSMNRLHRTQYDSIAEKFPTSRANNPTEAAIQLGEQRVLQELRKYVA